MASLTLRNIKKNFGKNQVLKGIDLDVKDGEFLVFIGPSGCGKTTLLRMIAGLEVTKKGEGEICINGNLVNKLSPVKRAVAMVFQSLALYPHMTVGKNIGFPLRVATQGSLISRIRAKFGFSGSHGSNSKKTVEEAVNRVAKILQIEHLLARLPSELSGGERQRVAIGRAMVRNPQVFLFDEPLSNLDPVLRSQMRMELRKLHEQLNATMIYVTHDQVEAMSMGDRIVVINEGLTQQVGTPMELYDRPANTFVAGFFGSPRVNLIPAKLITPDAQLSQVAFAPGLQAAAPFNTESVEAGSDVIFGIRPEHLQLAEVGTEGSLTGTVERLELMGDVVHVFINLPGVAEAVCAKLKTGNIMPAMGAPIAITIPQDKAMLFNAQGLSFTHAA
jgi:multiple sugar transport system ATP-binding protein